MTSNTTQHMPVRRSSRLASKAPQQAATSTKTARPSAPRLKKEDSARGGTKGKAPLSRDSTVPVRVQVRQETGKGKGRALEEIPSERTLDAKEAAPANASIDAGAAAADRGLLEGLVEKWKRAAASSGARREAMRGEFINEVKARLVVLRNRSAASRLENERANNSSQLLARELDKLRVEFRTKAEELDDYAKQVSALPPKFRLKADPYGEPFRECRRAQDPSSTLPETLLCELSRLRDEALTYAGPTVAQSDRSDSSDRTLVGNGPNDRKRRRDDEEESHGAMEGSRDGCRIAPTGIPTKRMRHGSGKR